MHAKTWIGMAICSSQTIAGKVKINAVREPPCPLRTVLIGSAGGCQFALARRMAAIMTALSQGWREMMLLVEVPERNGPSMQCMFHVNLNIDLLENFPGDYYLHQKSAKCSQILFL